MEFCTSRQYFYKSIQLLYWQDKFFFNYIMLKHKVQNGEID